MSQSQGIPTLLYVPGVVVARKKTFGVTVTAGVTLPPILHLQQSPLPMGPPPSPRSPRDIWKGLSRRRGKNKQAEAYQNIQAANIYRGYLPNTMRGKNLLSLTRKR